jgi:hypothetical protein
LSKGKLIEQGTHDQILEEFPNGTYAGFVSKQKTAEDKGGYSATPAKEVEEEIKAQETYKDRISEDIDVK